MPDGVTTTVTAVKTADDASAPGILYTVEGATTVVTLMHPRQDLSRHHLIPILLDGGLRGVGSGLADRQQRPHPHSRGSRPRRRRRFRPPARPRFRAHRRVRPVGRRDAIRVLHPAGQPGARGPHPADPRRQADSALDKATIPVPDGGGLPRARTPGRASSCWAASTARSPTRATRCRPCRIWISSSEANGFREPPNSSEYTPDFLARYREAQRARVARIDAHARHLIAERMDAKERFASSKRVADRRASIMSKVIAVYRTDADPRTVDLSLDPSDRPYGSIHGRRPDLINFGITGFGRLTTAEAWLSTWSGLQLERAVRHLRARGDGSRACSSNTPATRPPSRRSPARCSTRSGPPTRPTNASSAPTSVDRRPPTGRPAGRWRARPSWVGCGSDFRRPDRWESTNRDLARRRSRPDPGRGSHHRRRAMRRTDIAAS